MLQHTESNLELLDPATINTTLLTRVQYIFQVFLSSEGAKIALCLFEITGASSLLPPPLLWYVTHLK